MDTGLRKSEGLGLQWADIDLDAGTLRVWRKKVGRYTTLHLTTRAKDALVRHKATRVSREPLVFAGVEPTLKPMFAAIEAAGLNATPERVKAYGRATVHTLRHTFASRLVQAGFDLPKVQQLLGHTTIQMTMRYAHLAPDAGAERAASVLDAITRPTTKLEVVNR